VDSDSDAIVGLEIQHCAFDSRQTQSIVHVGLSKYNRVGLATKSDGTLYAAKEVEKRHFMKNGILDKKFDMEMKITRKIQLVISTISPLMQFHCPWTSLT
jgi:hypothetical protein